MSIFLLFPQPSKAETFYGLAMHGDAKYGPEDTHLTYANPDASKGGTLKQAAIGTFDTLNPYAIKGKAADGLSLVYDKLMARVWDEPFTMYPLIAESVDVPEDRSAITFHINEKARFNDGSPITADDVLFSFETLKEHGRPNMRRVYKIVEAAEKCGNLCASFKLGKGHDEETVMILAMMPVLSQSWWSGREFDSTTLDIPNTSGPYKITKVDPGRQIIYERNPDYWAKDLLVNVGHNNFGTITYDYFRDDTVALEAFKSGDLDFRRESDAGKWFSAYDIPAIQNGSMVKEAIKHGRPERVRAFIMNTRREPFDDIRIREALNLAFDFEWANENLFHSAYKRINSFYPNAMLAAGDAPSEKELKILKPWRKDIPASVFGPAYAPPVNAGDQKRRNLRKAMQLLKSAGWTVENGTLQKQGKPFEFEILLSAPEDEKLALHFKRSLERLGITPRIRVLDAAAYRGRLNEYDFDMTLYYWQNSLSPGTEQLLYWGCQAAEEPARWNFPGICNPAVDHIAKTIAESKTRIELVNNVHALDRILTHSQYIIPLYYKGEDYVAYNANIKHPEETAIYGMVIETWWAENNE